MCDKNLFPRPSPLEAPLTNPAISTNDIVVLIFFLEEDIFANLFNLSSGTGTIPSLGSIVQNGKFSAWALLEFVNALNKVDFPTFGRPTMPHRKLIYLLFMVLENNSNFLSNKIDKESVILFVMFSNFIFSSSSKSFNT